MPQGLQDSLFLAIPKRVLAAGYQLQWEALLFTQSCGSQNNLAG